MSAKFKAEYAQKYRAANLQRLKEYDRQRWIKYKARIEARRKRRLGERKDAKRSNLVIDNTDRRADAIENATFDFLRDFYATHPPRPLKVHPCAPKSE